MTLCPVIPALLKKFNVNPTAKLNFLNLETLGPGIPNSVPTGKLHKTLTVFWTDCYSPFDCHGKLNTFFFTNAPEWDKLRFFKANV